MTSSDDTCRGVNCVFPLISATGRRSDDAAGCLVLSALLFSLMLGATVFSEQSNRTIAKKFPAFTLFEMVAASVKDLLFHEGLCG